MPFHTICLRAPWDFQLESAGRCATCRRRFQRPTGLQPGQRVLLVIDSPGLGCRVILNSLPVPRVRHDSFPDVSVHDVSHLLVDRNILELELSLDGQSPGPDAKIPLAWDDRFASVRLEIEEH